jgi:transcriptional regulator with XRE-family HTH domain
MTGKTAGVQSQVILGKNIKRYREKTGLTQETLSEKLDISVQHLSNLERGRSFVTAELLDKIANTFDITFSDLFIDDLPAQTSRQKTQSRRIAAIIDNEILDFHVKIKKRIIDSL